MHKNKNIKPCFNCRKEYTKLTFIKLPNEHACAFICDNCLPQFEQKKGYEFKGVWRGKGAE